MVVSNYGDTSGDEIKFCDESKIVDSHDNEALNEDDIESNEEMDLIDQFYALENEETSDIRTIDEKCVEEGTFTAEYYDDNNSKCLNKAEPEVQFEKVKKMVEIDCSHSDSIRSKGFSTRICGRVRIVCNLPLMASASKCSEYEVECEGFPIQMMEDELIPLFEKHGQVYKLVKTVSNKIFVTYTNTNDAQKAVESLNRSNVQGHMVKAFKSLPNGRLIVRPIPKSATKKELFHRFGSVTFDLLSVSLYNDPVNESKNRGFCYLDYGDHYKASSAKQMLSSKKMFGMPLKVDWPIRHYNWVETHDTLYISNLRSSICCENLKKFFSVYGELVGVKQIGNFGKVQFQNVEDAKRAAREINKNQLGNENVEISFVKLSQKIAPKNEHGLSDTLYINNLSSIISTSDLRKIFSRYGGVVESDKNSDFASVRFQDSEEAKRAARYIDKNQLGCDVQISFVKHTEKASNKKFFKKLYISNMRSDITVSDLRKQFSVYGEVTEVDKDGDSASVRFRNSENANHAVQDFDKRRLGNNVDISFHPQSENKTQKKLPVVSDKLYINNLYANMKAWRVRQIFEVYAEVIEVDKNGTSASVQFRNSDDAKRAAQEVNRIHLGNKANLEISFFPKIH